MEAYVFSKIETNGEWEHLDGYSILSNWKFINIHIPDVEPVKFRRDQVDPPKTIMIRDRVLFLDYN